jgi:23S rRNA (adenine2503-C2)-methyltransferase
MPLNKPSIFSASKAEINFVLDSSGISTSLSSSILENLYKRKKRKNVLSKKLNKLLEEKFDFNLPKIKQVNESEDGTIKFLLGFDDDMAVETVLIPFHHKFTVCLSTQVGCAMKCSFCYTGTMGLKRHLNAGEIIGQYMVAWNHLRDILPDHDFTPNIVFMGQGEPLHNADSVKKAIEIFMESSGLGIGPRQMTLSTAGHLPGLKKFGSFPKINLALSLHSPFNEIRNKLIPINEQWPLEDIFAELKTIEAGLIKNQFIVYEYLLIKDLNDRDEDAKELAVLLKDKKSIINIIPFNPFPGSEFKRPSPDDVDVFKEKLVALKLRTHVRTTKGNDILAACGQLISAKKTIKPV